METLKVPPTSMNEVESRDSLPHTAPFRMARIAVWVDYNTVLNGAHANAKRASDAEDGRPLTKQITVDHPCLESRTYIEPCLNIHPLIIRSPSTRKERTMNN